MKLTFTDVVPTPKHCTGSCYYRERAARASILGPRRADAIRVFSVLSFRVYLGIRMTWGSK